MLLLSMVAKDRSSLTRTWLYKVYLSILVLKGVPDGRFRARKALPLPGSHQGPFILLRFLGLGGLVWLGSPASLFATLQSC